MRIAILELTTEAILFGLRVLLLGVLYLFLLAVLQAIRRDVRRTADQAATQPPESPAQSRAAIVRLVVDNPGSTSLQPGAVLPIQASTRIGRSSRNTIVLDDAFVSSEHALISNRDGGWWLTDLESTNGTYLNDAPVGGQAPLADGDVIGIGDIRLRVSS